MLRKFDEITIKFSLVLGALEGHNEPKLPTSVTLGPAVYNPRARPTASAAGLYSNNQQNKRYHSFFQPTRYLLANAVFVFHTR